MDSILQFREKGGDKPWYRPDRDILQCWPGIIIKGSIFAADPASAIHNWLKTQDDWKKEYDSIPAGVEATLRMILDAINEAGLGDIDKIIQQKPFVTSLYQAVMMAAGAMGMHEYGRFFRESATRTAAGGALLPVEPLDIERGMAFFRSNLR